MNVRPQPKGIALQPTLSLIVPVCNVQTTLADTIHRVLDVLSEMTSRFELLLIDNGSNDQTTDVAYELAREFPQIRVVRHYMPDDIESVVQAAAEHARGEVLLVQSPGSVLEAVAIRPVIVGCPVSSAEIPQHPQGLSANLLEKLSRWGKAIAPHAKLNEVALDSGSSLANDGPATLPIGSKAVPRRPQSFLAHLREMASNSTRLAPS